jgi:HK97 family phage prohead protease
MVPAWAPPGDARARAQRPPAFLGAGEPSILPHEMRRTTVNGAVGKFLAGGVTDRQVRVVASDGTPDRMGDVLEPFGVKLDAYRKNPVVLGQHNADAPIGRCVSIGIEGAQIIALIEFPPMGTSELADEYCNLTKAGVISAVSVGFLPLASTPIRDGGWRYTSWELLELSLVSIPANPNALVIARSLDRADRLRRAAELRIPRRPVVCSAEAEPPWFGCRINVQRERARQQHRTKIEREITALHLRGVPGSREGRRVYAARLQRLGQLAEAWS